MSSLNELLFNTPFRLTSRTSHLGSSKSSLKTSSRSLMPAFAQTMSTCPWSFRASLNMLTISDHDLTSHLQNVTLAGNSSGGGLTSALMTLAPCSAKDSTVAFPIPLEPPSNQHITSRRQTGNDCNLSFQIGKSRIVELKFCHNEEP
jgi:hypothetical protein